MLRQVFGEVHPDRGSDVGAIGHLDAIQAAFAERGMEGVKAELERQESEGIEVAEACPEDEPPEREWLVRGWLPSGRVALFTGKGEGGKSRVTM